MGNGVENTQKSFHEGQSDDSRERGRSDAIDLEQARSPLKQIQPKSDLSPSVATFFDGLSSMYQRSPAARYKLRVTPQRQRYLSPRTCSPAAGGSGVRPPAALFDATPSPRAKKNLTMRFGESPAYPRQRSGLGVGDVPSYELDADESLLGPMHQ